MSLRFVGSCMQCCVSVHEGRTSPACTDIRRTTHLQWQQCLEHAQQSLKLQWRHLEAVAGQSLCYTQKNLTLFSGWLWILGWGDVHIYVLAQQNSRQQQPWVATSVLACGAGVWLLRMQMCWAWVQASGGAPVTSQGWQMQAA